MSAQSHSGVGTISGDSFSELCVQELSLFDASCLAFTGMFVPEGVSYLDLNRIREGPQMSLHRDHFHSGWTSLFWMDGESI